MASLFNCFKELIWLYKKKGVISHSFLVTYRIITTHEEDFHNDGCPHCPDGM